MHFDPSVGLVKHIMRVMMSCLVLYLMYARKLIVRERFVLILGERKC